MFNHSFHVSAHLSKLDWSCFELLVVYYFLSQLDYFTAKIKFKLFHEKIKRPRPSPDTHTKPTHPHEIVLFILFRSIYFCFVSFLGKKSVTLSNDCCWSGVIFERLCQSCWKSWLNHISQRNFSPYWPLKQLQNVNEQGLPFHKPSRFLFSETFSSICWSVFPAE